LTTVTPSDSALAHVGQVANEYAARNVFTDYLSRKADNTIRLCRLLTSSDVIFGLQQV
jgi:hypothetical protein